MMSKKVAGTPYILSLVLIIIGVLFFYLSLEYRDRKFETYSDRIKKLEELVTARQIYRNVIYTEIKENFIVDKRSLFTIDYIVTAGVDFSGGVKIDAQNSAVRVTYPYPEILSVDADESTIDEYFSLQRFGPFEKFGKPAENDFQGTTGLAGALAWMLCPRGFGHAHFVALDMLLAFFFFAAIVAFLSRKRPISTAILAGILWGALYIFRGFGITVGSHITWNIYLALVNAMG